MKELFGLILLIICSYKASQDEAIFRFGVIILLGVIAMNIKTLLKE